MRPLALLLAVAACIAASSVQASPGAKYGIQDDAWLEFGPGTLKQRLLTFKRLGVPLVRFTLHWNEVAPDVDPDGRGLGRAVRVDRREVPVVLSCKGVAHIAGQLSGQMEPPTIG